MKKILIGRSPLTSIAGFVLATLLSIHQVGTQGGHNWQDFVLPAAIALFGRMAGDDHNQPPLPPLPMPDSPELPDFPTQPDAFQRRGKEHRQRRGTNGRFAPATA